jgi:hypothetical protein
MVKSNKKMQSGGKATADSTKYYKYNAKLKLDRDTRVSQDKAFQSAEARKIKPGYDDIRGNLVNPVIKKAVKKMQNGGSLSGLKASTKRVGPVDPNGAWTKVQKKTLAGARGKAVLKKDKQLDASRIERKQAGGGKMKMGGKVSKKK